MAVKLNDDVLEGVRGLITEVSHFTEEDENFHLCYKYAISNICNHRFLSVNRHLIKQSLDNLVLRFRVHGHTTNAQRLEKLIGDFVNNPVFTDHPQSDVQWSILSLLMNLTGGLTNITAEVAVKNEEEPFDWVAYLREGDVEIHYSSDTDSDEDRLSLEDPEVQEGAAEVREDGCVGDGEVCLVGGEGGALLGGSSRCDQMKQCLLSKEWLANNVQPNWWSSSSITDPGCSFPRINTAHLWNSYASQAGSDVPGREVANTLSEYKVLREVLFMLRMPADMRVFVRVGEKYCVRPDLTIPSLTQEAFRRIMQEMCVYFDMLAELQGFVASVRGAPAALTPPLTYKAYCCLVVDPHIRKLGQAVTSIESRVRRQEKPHTLLSVKKELQPFLDDLKTLYVLHQRATMFPWQSSPNWLCATCMLSVVNETMESAADDHQASVMLTIFMKVFSPYLRIANIWLTGGQLQDESQEFIITKIQSVWARWLSRRTDGTSSSPAYLGEEFQLRPFEEQLSERGVQPAPVLLGFANQVLQAGKTMEFLHRMNRVAEIRRQPETCGELFLKLSKDSSMLSVILIERVVAALVQIQAGESTGIIGDGGSSDESVDSAPREEFLGHVRQLGDPYLLAVFDYPARADVQPTELFPPAHSYQLEQPMENKAFKRLGELQVGAVVPLRQLLQDQLERLLEECHAASCRLVRHILFAELLLPTHFSLVRYIVLGEAGDIMHDFASCLFAQVEHGILNTYSLSNNLESCVDERFPEYSCRFAVTETKDSESLEELRASLSQLSVPELQPLLHRAHSAMAVINTVHIHYKVDWPISLFLSDSNMRYYNRVFQFLLEIKWALNLLNHLRPAEVGGAAGCGKRLQVLRFWLTHTLGSVHSYLMGQVLQAESFQLQQALDTAHDLHTLLQAHDNYVKAIYRKCFRPSKMDFIVCGVHQLVAQVYVLKACWTQGVSVAVSDILESMYNHTHCMVTMVLRLHVEEDFDSELEGLYSALDDRIPFPEAHL